MMSNMLSSLRASILAPLGSFSLLGGAYIFQALGYAPCAMCLWQRWPHAAAILIGLLYLATKQRFLLLLGAVAALITAGIGIYHTGVERKFWLGPQSCTSSGQDLGALAGDALLPSAGDAPRLVLCDAVVWDLFGLSMASYNALFSIGFAALWLAAFRRT